MSTTTASDDLRRRARELNDRLRPQIETPENIGRIVVMDVESGDYEIDDEGIETSFRLQARRPGAPLHGMRIGYETAASFSGALERLAP